MRYSFLLGSHRLAMVPVATLHRAEVPASVHAASWSPANPATSRPVRSWCRSRSPPACPTKTTKTPHCRSHGSWPAAGRPCRRTASSLRSLWDVESGRTSLDLRGRSDAHELFDGPVPRDGSVADLLEEARHADRRFVAVVCESVDGSPESPASVRRSSTSWSTPGSRCWPTKASPPTHSRALPASWPASVPRRS